MTKDRYMTIRLPADVEAALRQQARDNTRTLAAQVLHYIKEGIRREPFPWEDERLQQLSQESNKVRG